MCCLQNEPVTVLLQFYYKNVKEITKKDGYYDTFDKFYVT